MKWAFLPSKGYCVSCDKQNNTWLLADMEFLFSCSTQREIPYLHVPKIISKCHPKNKSTPVHNNVKGTET